MKTIAPTAPSEQICSRVLRHWLYLFCICASACATLSAQTFEPIPALGFNKVANSTSNPLPQVITATSTGASLGFSVSATSTTGGNWLSTSPSGSTFYTPQVITVTANPDASLAAGTYTGKIIFTSGSTVTLTVPVSLTVEPTSATFFDELPGALTFSMKTSGTAPPAQPLPIRNAGAGTLSWTSSVSTADGGKWLSLSASSGTAPATPNVLITPASLPHAGEAAGTFTGQVLLHTTGGSVSVPITVTVGDPIFLQANPLSFTKTLDSTSNPLSQVFTVGSTSSSIGFSISAVNGTGGDWLSINPNGSTYYTPNTITATVNPDVTLSSGTYTAQIVVRASNGSQALVVPVTLSVEPSGSSFFDDLPGQITFSMQTGGKAPPTESVSIRNAGSGTLAYTASTSTSDGGKWLAVSSASGTTPSTVSVGITSANLPEEGKVAGTFTGQLVLTGSGDTVTIPVTVTVGDSVFAQVNPLSFTKTADSISNPLPQTFTLASTGSTIGFSTSAVNGTGGSWLSINPNGSTYYTPQSVTVSVKPDVSLAAGTYNAEIIARTSNGAESAVIPVSLTIQPSTAAFFDELPGELTFSVLTSGIAPPPQLVQIRNAGTGTLTFTASTSTADGGSWITLSAARGTAPYLLNIGINPANLPSGGKVAGTFTGQVDLKTSTGTVTIPVTATVGDPVFAQINPISFSKAINSTDQPMPQVITIASTSSEIGFSVTAIEGTGGSWLSINPNGSTYYTSTAVTLTANPDVKLAAGTYTAQVLVRSSNGAESVVVPVTLDVEPTTAPFFDTLPGALTFSAQATGTTPASQPLAIRNAGPGTLDWAASTSTADGGKWITLSAVSGTAPMTPTVSINIANLPGKGRVAGTYVGQVMLQSVNDIVTVPVTVTIGDSVFKQPAAISFSKNYQAANPPTQAITLASTDASLGFSIGVINATGGSWLSSNINGSTYYTPQTVTLTANPNVNLASGVYTAEVYVRASNGSEPVVVPVSLTIDNAGATGTPTFTPPAGSYSTNQSVTINDSTRDAAIYYTTDGSTPTTASKRYSAPLSVTASLTIKAIAVAPGYPQSAVASAVYTMTAPVAATPTVTQTITITEATSSVAVYYTTDGSIPTTSSHKYTGPLTLSFSSVLKFIAIGPGYSSSAVRTITTTIQ